VKGLAWQAVRLVYDSDALKAWCGARNAPVVVHADDRPRSGWAEILLLAERLQAEPALLPAEAGARAEVLGLAHELMGEEGLCWSRRLQLVHAGLTGGMGFKAPVARYLAKRYGYREPNTAAADARVHALLALFATRLQAQHARGSDYLVGSTLTAADIYLATALAMFTPLPEADCRMEPDTRAAFEWLDDRTRAALDPVLFELRERVYARHLERPLSL
jgi:glutathione S-transferase